MAIKREREDDQLGKIVMREHHTRTPAEIRARFKITAERKFLRFAQETNLSESDFTTIVLCSMQTLLSPVQQVATGREGQVPCEGYFIVVKTSEPSRPIFEKGFIFFPPQEAFRRTKQAVQNLSNRIAQSHGIDPREYASTGQRWRQQLQSTNDMSMAICKSVDDVAGILDAVVTAADSLRDSKMSTTVFVTDSGSKGAVELALFWMQTQRRMKLSSVAVQTPEMIFGDDWCDEGVIGELPLMGDEHDRCVAHPRSSLNRFGQPFFCARDECRVLHRKLRLYAQYCEASLSTDSGAGQQGGDPLDGSDTESVPEFLKDLQRMEEEEQNAERGCQHPAGDYHVQVDLGSDDDDERAMNFVP